jgi:processing peptidase subunit alpha
MVLTKALLNRSITSIAKQPLIKATKEASGASISTLSNGIRVASHDQKGHFCALGVFIDAGPRYEPAHLRGLSNFVERLSLKSTLHKSRSDVAGIIERVGSNVTSTCGRENIIVQGSVFRHDFETTLELFADTVRYPQITEDEMDEVRGTIDWELNNNYDKPEWLIPELAHQTAFANNTYGIPQYTPLGILNDITRDQVEEYRKLFYRPSRIVLASVGVPHDLFCEYAEKYFGSMKEPQYMQPVVEPVKYTGGELIHENDAKDLTSIFLGFESPRLEDPDLYAASVLQILLGGGDSFSAGGPGKGMYSRLYTRVLNRMPWVESITATNVCHKDSGLFGFQGKVPHGIAPNFLSIIGSEIRAILDQKIYPEEIQRAKNQLRSSLFMALEAKLVSVEDMGRQIQMTGRRICPKEMSEKIEMVTEEDIKRVFAKIVSKRPTFVLSGKKTRIPDIADFEAQFGLGRRMSIKN